MTHPTSFRLSEPTAQELVWLANVYGNQTTAITVAIHDLFEKKRSTMPFSEIVSSPHFHALSEFLHAPLRGSGWRTAHPEAPVAFLENQVTETATAQMFATNRQECVNRLMQLLSTIAEADPERSYSEADLTWLVQLLDGPTERALAILWLLLAHAGAPRQAPQRQTSRMTVVAAQMIGPYVAPNWLIDFVGTASDQEDLNAINAAEMEILRQPDTVMGWGEYNAIIRITDPECPGAGSTEYLAKLA